jgi:hypothetical protein
MKKVSMQFHALPEEITLILNEIVNKKELYISCLGTVNNFSVSNYLDSIALELVKKETVFIALQLRNPDFACNNRKDFDIKNKGALYITLGFKKENELRESIISGYLCEDSKKLESVLAYFKKKLHKGCIVINPETNASAKVSNHYYSDGAVAFEKTHGTLLAFAGGNIYSVQ